MGTHSERENYGDEKILALAKSMGWMTTLANVAAEPPQTNGSAMLAIPPFFSGMFDNLENTVIELHQERASETDDNG